MKFWLLFCSVSLRFVWLEQKDDLRWQGTILPFTPSWQDNSGFAVGSLKCSTCAQLILVVIKGTGCLELIFTVHHLKKEPLKITLFFLVSIWDPVSLFALHTPPRTPCGGCPGTAEGSSGRHVVAVPWGSTRSFTIYGFDWVHCHRRVTFFRFKSKKLATLGMVEAVRRLVYRLPYLFWGAGQCWDIGTASCGAHVLISCLKM